MTCLLCKQGETLPGYATVVFQRDETVIIFKEAPAEVCENCGEYYLSENVTRKLLERAEKAIENGAEVEILRFAAKIPAEDNGGYGGPSRIAVSLP